jgi:prepilin-type N-terminal cleavage/methylation domain-containing protein
MKKTKGLTLMELTIVLAILVIIAGILVPIFILSTDRARLRGDIQSAVVIQNAVDLYRMERGRSVDGYPNNVETMVTNLVDARYINSRRTRIQTESATWTVVQGEIMVNISNSPEEVHRAFESLSEDERRYVHGGVLNR